MSISKLTPQQQKIWDAAIALSDAGHKPTNELVRKRLGGGTFSTISPVLKMWRAYQDEEKAKATKPSPIITAALEEAGRRIHLAMLKDRQETLEAIRIERAKNESEYAERLKEMELEIQALEANKELAEEALTAKDDQIKSLAAEHAGQIALLAHRLDETKTSLAEATSDVAAAEQENASLRVDLALARKDLDAERAAIGDLKGTLKKSNDRADASIKSAETERQERIRIGELAARVRDQLEAAQRAHQQTTVELDAAKNEAQQSAALRIRFEEKCGLLESTVERLEARIADQARQLAEQSLRLSQPEPQPSIPTRKGRKPRNEQ